MKYAIILAVFCALVGAAVYTIQHIQSIRDVQTVGDPSQKMNDVHTQKESTPRDEKKQEEARVTVMPPVFAQSARTRTVTWYPAARPVGDLHFVAHSDAMLGAPEYAELGTVSGGGTLVSLVLPCDGMCGADAYPYFLIVNHDGGASLLVRYLDEGAQDVYEKNNRDALGIAWSSNVSFDTATHVPELDAPTYVIEKNGHQTTVAPSGTIFFSKEVATSNRTVSVRGLVSMVRLRTERPVFENVPSLHLEHLFRVLPVGLAQKYYATPDFYPNYGGVPNVTWENGTHATVSYRVDGVGGCGGQGAIAVVDADAQIDMRPVGTLATGDPVYSVGVDHPLTKEMYALSGGKRFLWDSATQSGSVEQFTVSDFVKNHGLLFYNDALGRTVMLISSEYGPQAECGKPVVYLYPEHDTRVHVTVGADIRISIPTYGDGWEVLAHSDGRLEHTTGTYPYLFWEGKGHGAYPEKNEGHIVERSRVATAVRDDLFALGLRGREITDFIEFWLPRMPQTPYVRLTWLGTDDMNRLAPLSVTPTPETTIRVFLDAEGVNVPYPLAPQSLAHRARKGFTVIEWGGLLR